MTISSTSNNSDFDRYIDDEYGNDDGNLTLSELYIAYQANAEYADLGHLPDTISDTEMSNAINTGIHDLLAGDASLEDLETILTIIEDLKRDGKNTILRQMEKSALSTYVAGQVSSDSLSESERTDLTERYLDFADTVDGTYLTYFLVSLPDASDAANADTWRIVLTAAMEDLLDPSAGNQEYFERFLPYILSAGPSLVSDSPELMLDLYAWSELLPGETDLVAYLSAASAIVVDDVFDKYASGELTLEETLTTLEGSLGPVSNSANAEAWQDAFEQLLAGMVTDDSDEFKSIYTAIPSAEADFFYLLVNYLVPASPDAINSLAIGESVKAWRAYYNDNDESAIVAQMDTWIDLVIDAGVGYPFAWIADVAIDVMTTAMDSKQTEIDNLMTVYQGSVDQMEWEQELLNKLREYDNEFNKDDANDSAYEDLLAETFSTTLVRDGTESLSNVSVTADNGVTYTASTASGLINQLLADGYDIDDVDSYVLEAYQDSGASFGDNASASVVANGDGTYTIILADVELGMKAALSEMGINLDEYITTSKKLKDEDSYDRLLEAITTELDSQSTLSELQMLELNTAITEFSELNSALSAIIDSITQALQSVTTNTTA